MKNTSIMYSLVIERIRYCLPLLSLANVLKEVFDDGHMEVARFLGTEDILDGEEVIYKLIERSN
jgi:hypothetical protein